MRHGTPAQAGLDPAWTRRLVAEIRALPEGPAPCCAGVVAVAGRGPVVAVEEAAGWALRYGSYDVDRGRGVPLARERWEPVRAGTVFDLASLSKLFTAIAVLQRVERGALGLDDPVARHLPSFAPAVTIRHLLTHTSGLAAELPLYDGPLTGDDRFGPLWAEAAGAVPGPFRYSDLGFITLQLLLEAVEGEPLDALVRDGITGPLGMISTSYGPLAPAGVAATEAEALLKARRPSCTGGVVRGEVHDENAYAVGGVAGQAGLFATAQDLAVLCRALLTGGGPVLRPETVDLMLTPPGLGFRVAQPGFMGELAERGAAGHTGFTGTSLVLDRASDTFFVLLTNAVHPRRGGEPVPRARLATYLARASAG
ncbi:serine hydrolase domain-containing protein [Streptomyces sp. NPDC053560]|uniref:serine hydrolase domain-containing protein n=1 Tax=Streptomyces sp. NPDC053560 TaxID=3365711 RepID=UPI0037D1D0D1